MKRFAFTMMELVFVIVAAGILSATMIPRMDRDLLSEAAYQVANHIRYTQHLAMVDDKYMPIAAMSTQANAASRTQEAQNWYLGRWQVRFSTANGTLSYMIMSDSPISSYDGNPNASTNFSYSEVAQNPIDPSKYLIGTTYSSFAGGSSDNITQLLDLKKTYDINDIDIKGGTTGSSANRIIFDHLGRPYRGNTSLAAGGITSSTDKLAQSNITIKLCKSSCTASTTTVAADERLITIHPETGLVEVKYK